MEILYRKYCALHPDGSRIGLEQGDHEGGYFCTPQGAYVLGWDNGIHYCTIEGFGDMVFCVNPEPEGEQYVYPVAENFRDFLGLLLSACHTNPLHYVISMTREELEAFQNDPENKAWYESPETQAVLASIRSALGIAPIADYYGYIRNLQKDFLYDSICYTDDYYDTLGLDIPGHPSSEETYCGEAAACAAAFYEYDASEETGED